MSAVRKYLLQLAFCLIAFVFILPASGQELRTRRNNIEVRRVPDSVVNKMKKDPAFAYANDSSYWNRRQSDPGAFARFMNTISKSVFLRVVLFLALVAGLIFAIYQVMVANNFFFTARRKRNTTAGLAGDGELSPENLDERILEETRKGNYRQAVRYMYLRTLKLLSEYNFITLHSKSTNQDYIRQMYKHNNFGQFRQLTRIYEYVWYGEFDPSESQFKLIQANFNQFNPRS